MSTEPTVEQMISETAPSASPAAAAEGQTAEGQAPQTVEEWEYEVQGGKKVKEPRDMVLKRAGMGYHYAQQMHQINQEREKHKGWEAERETLTQKMQALARWQEFNDYAEKNPQWAKHVEDTWNNRETLGQSEQQIDNPLMTKVQTLEQRLAEIAETTQRREAELAQQKQAVIEKEQDTKFDSEIKSVSKQYGVDLSQADEQGRSLEWRVMEHMAAMGLDGTKEGHFRAAFRDYYFDNLVEKKAESAKESLAKEQDEMRKAGILGISRTPKSSRAFNPASMSYNDLGAMALAELAQAKK